MTYHVTTYISLSLSLSLSLCGRSDAMLPVDASPYGECDLFVVGGFIAWHVKRIVWIVALGQVSFRFNGILDEVACNLKFFFDSTLALMVLYVVWVCIVTCSSARGATILHFA